MTFQQVLNIVKNAKIIKQWSGEYRIYAPKGTTYEFALINCDKNGKVTSFVANIDGAIYELSDVQQKQLQAALELRMQEQKIKSIYANPQNKK